MASGDSWKVAVFSTTTGQIQIDDLAVVGIPQFSRQINQTGSISITVQLGSTSVPPRDTLRGLLVPWKMSLAVYRGNTIAQAGPITDLQPSASAQQVTVSATGIWGLFNRRLLVKPAYSLSPTSGGSLLTITSAGDTVYNNLALHDIAAHLVSDNMSRGSSYALPVDVPTDVGGTSTRTYPLSDFATVGARLQELTQVDFGPDVDFKPYFDPANAGYIRWLMRVGNPVLQQAGAAVFFDLDSDLEPIGVDCNGSALATGVFLKSSASTNTVTAVYSHNAGLTSAGFPELEMIDANHTDAFDATTMQGWADGDLDLYSGNVETWTASVRLDDPAPSLSTYDPGTYATFNVTRHWWQPDGEYVQRILGWSQGSTASNLALILQAVQGGL